MITTKIISEYLKTLFPTDIITTGFIDRNNKQCIALYCKGDVPLYNTIGHGTQAIAGIPIVVLVHWTDNYDTCETKANLVYEALKNMKMVATGGFVLTAQLKQGYAVDIGRDDHNICERSIPLNVIYQV